MQRVNEQVDSAYLQQPPPRPLPATLVLNLLYDYIFERPLRTFLDPVVIGSVIALFLLYLLRSSTALRMLPLIVLVIRLAINTWLTWRRAREDLSLLRYGLTIRAHVLGLRPYRTTVGAIDGALLDCAIPVAPRRTYVGSIWLSDGNEAQRLSRQGLIEVLCLPYTPGTWRVIENVKTDIRYDRRGPTQEIPPEV